MYPRSVFWLERGLAGLQKVAHDCCEDQARGGPLTFLFGSGVSAIINCDQYLAGAFTRFFECQRGGRSDGVTALNSSLPVMNYILATTALTQPNAKTGQDVVEEYLVGLAAREPQLGNAGFCKFMGTSGYTKKGLWNFWEATGKHWEAVRGRL